MTAKKMAASNYLDLAANCPLDAEMVKQDGMKRSLKQWRFMSPRAVCEGSDAQKFFCIEDARHDILALSAENERLKAELADAQERTNAAVEDFNDALAHVASFKALVAEMVEGFGPFAWAGRLVDAADYDNDEFVYDSNVAVKAGDYRRALRLIARAKEVTS